MSEILPPTPRLTQPWLIPFRQWKDRYSYFVDCILTNIVTSISSSAIVDRVGMRRDLERYLYKTSHNRFKRYVQLSGPRPGMSG